MISQAVLAGAMWLFRSCSPVEPPLQQPPPAILAGIAMQESGFDPDAIHDNTTGRSFYPGAPNAAVDLAVQLRGQGHVIDVGLLGIDYTDWQRHNVPLVASFDECANIRISSEILMGDYQSSLRAGYRGRTAWIVALSEYNTGGINATGIAYANSVLANTEALWPRIVAIAQPAAIPMAVRPTPSGQAFVAPRPVSTPPQNSLSEAIRIARARQARAARAYAAIEQEVKARAGGNP